MFVLVNIKVIYYHIRTTNQSIKPPSFLQTQKVSSNHTQGTSVEGQQLALPETEATREVREVARQPAETAVVVVVAASACAAVVGALEIAVVVDIAEWADEKLRYCSWLYERQV